MSTALSYHSIAQSNLPSHEKSKFIRLAESLRGGGGRALARARTHAVATGCTVRQGGESILVAGALAAAHVELPQGLDLKGKIPLDAVIGAAGLLGSIVFAHEEVATDLRNAGASALSIFTFRKAHDYLEMKKKQRGEVPGSTAAKGAAPAATPAKVAGEWEVGSDPIVAAARLL